ncbi:NFACT family protein [Gemmiger formicilis]|nr:NFACT family protein [Gemmiger formicilis]
MTLRTRTETHRLLLSARSGSARVCLTKESFENPLTPPGFCMLLRKHLTGGRLIELRREPGTASSILTSAARTRWATWSRTRWPSS